jgi:hypothetical protein
MKQICSLFADNPLEPRNAINQLHKAKEKRHFGIKGNEGKDLTQQNEDAAIDERCSRNNRKMVETIPRVKVRFSHRRIRQRSQVLV